MQKTSTPFNVEGSKTQQTLTPRKSTVDFIKQFARAYSYSRRMPSGLGGFVVN